MYVYIIEDYALSRAYLDFHVHMRGNVKLNGQPFIQLRGSAVETAKLDLSLIHVVGDSGWL